MHIFGVVLQTLLEELEMLDLRMAGEIDLAGDLERLGLGIDAVKFDRRRADPLDSLQAPEEIEMPPGAAEFAIGGELQAYLFLAFDDLLDLAVFDGFQRGGVDFALGVLARAHPSAARCAAGCRHGRRGRGVSCVGSWFSPYRPLVPAKAGTQFFLPDSRLRGNERAIYLPHTSSASSTTMRSLAHCSSSASTLPSSVEAKPHCGDRQN